MIYENLQLFKNTSTLFACAFIKKIIIVKLWPVFQAVSSVAQTDLQHHRGATANNCLAKRQHTLIDCSIQTTNQCKYYYRCFTAFDLYLMCASMWPSI